MVLSRGEQRTERVTITFVPTADERSYRHVPSTFSVANRRYGWRHYETVNYMIVPRKISSSEIKVDMFVGSAKGKRIPPSDVQKVVHGFVDMMIHSEWQGLRLAGISRATLATPPEQVIGRGTIEEILGTNLDM